MKNGLFIFLVLFFSCTLPAVSSSWSETEDGTRVYQVLDFDRIELKGGYKVFLKQSDQPELRIKASDEAFDNVDVETFPGTLKVEITKTYLNFKCIELHISFVDLKEMHVEGGINLETAGFIDLNDFYLRVEGGAKIRMGMKVDHLVVVGEGGVSLGLKGVAKKMDAKISGLGYLNASQLTAEEVSFKVQGIGGGSVHATRLLNATIEGVGKINYLGNPEVEKAISGIGLVARE